MKRIVEGFWPIVGLAAVAFSAYLLYRNLRGHSPAEVYAAFAAIPLWRWPCALFCAIAAYAALACYDAIALQHLGRPLSWRFVAAVSFVAYALAHNIGATMVSGAVVRYRAYSSRGLTGAEVGVLVGFTSLTFALGALLTGGLALIAEPAVLSRWIDAPPWGAPALAAALLAGPWAYMLGALLHLRPFRLGGFSLVYPRPPVAARQMVVAPFELIGAAGIIYFALPPEANLSFFVVLAVFLAAFTAALVSHAPGGLGVLELTFLKATPDAAPAQVIAALLVFRLLYLVAPLIVSLGLVAMFERRALVGSRG